MLFYGVYHPAATNLPETGINGLQSSPPSYTQSIAILGTMCRPAWRVLEAGFSLRSACICWAVAYLSIIAHFYRFAFGKV